MSEFIIFLITIARSDGPMKKATQALYLLIDARPFRVASRPLLAGGCCLQFCPEDACKKEQGSAYGNKFPVKEQLTGKYGSGNK